VNVDQIICSETNCYEWNWLLFLLFSATDSPTNKTKSFNVVSIVLFSAYSTDPILTAMKMFWSDEFNGVHIIGSKTPNERKNIFLKNCTV
jgi:hypothetical protein